MKKFLLGLLVGLTTVSGVAYGASVLAPFQGGTGSSSYTIPNTLLYWNGTQFVSTSTNPLYVSAIVATSTTVSNSFLSKVGIGTRTPGSSLVVQGSGAYAQIVNTNTAGNGLLNFDETDNGFTHDFFIKKFGSTAATPGVVQLWNVDNAAIEMAINNQRALNLYGTNSLNAILQIESPAGGNEGDLVARIVHSANNYSTVELDIENYAVDNVSSIVTSKTGTGQLKPFGIRFWNQDAGIINTTAAWWTYLTDPAGGTAIGGFSTTTYDKYLPLQVASSTASTTLVIDSTAGTHQFVFKAPAQQVGFGTTSPTLGVLTVASSTAPQLALSSGTGISQWDLRNAGGNLYIATTTTSGTATSTLSAITVLGSSGNVGIASSTPQAKLEIGGIAGTDGIRYPDYTLQTSNGIIIVEDDKTANTAGGSASAGKNTRVLNTTVVNTILGASLSSNQVTLPAGTYRVEASAPAFNVFGHKLVWFNVTDTATTTIGQNAYSNSDAAAFGQSPALLTGYFTISAAKTFNLFHYTAGAQATNGLGVVSNMGMTEVYAQVKITRQ